MLHTGLKALRRLVAEEHGIQHVEEALLLALIAVAAITVTTALGDGVEAVFQTAADELAPVAAP
ncbi:MAG: Flp family type IVb pilin [Chloroflexi bacterium]|nr:Flp family type IVb pilin [Chloroflexota bacterium]